MKTKKTYTRYRVGLFIGLFSFHTLASCVNKGGQLGMGCFESEEAKQKKKKENDFHKKIKQAQEAKPLHSQSPINFAKDPCNKLKVFIWSLVGIGTGILGLGAYYCLTGSSSIAGIMNNRTLDNNGTKVRINSNRTAFEQTRQSYVDINATPSPNVSIKINSIAVTKVREANFSKKSIEELLRTETIDVRDEHHRTLLMHAAQEGEANTLDYLTDKKADVDAKDKAGNTALMYAALAGKQANVRLLLEKKANLFTTNNNNNTAKYFAQYAKNSSIIKKLDKAEQKWAAQHHNHKREVSNVSIIEQLNEAEKILEKAQEKFGKPPYKKSRKRKK